MFMGEGLRKKFSTFLKTEKAAEYMADQMVLKLLCISESVRGFVPTDCWFQGFVSVGLGWWPIICILGKLPSDAVYHWGTPCAQLL